MDAYRTGDAGTVQRLNNLVQSRNIIGDGVSVFPARVRVDYSPI